MEKEKRVRTRDTMKPSLPTRKVGLACTSCLALCLRSVSRDDMIDNRSHVYKRLTIVTPLSTLLVKDAIPVQVLLRGFGIEAEGLTRMHLDAAKQLKRLKVCFCALASTTNFRIEGSLLSSIHFISVC